jgi:hypothetical protein
MSKTNVPSIPLPRAENLLDVAKAVKGILDVREGFIGDPLDQNVTFRDLVDAGAVSVRPNWNTTSGLTPVIPTWANPDGYDPVSDLTPPDKPANFTVTSMFSAVQLQWDLPAQRNFAYAEIWRSSTNVIGDAVLLGTSDTRFYVDQLGTSSTKYYWIRFVSQANVKGPYNSTNGAAGTAGDDPAYVIGVLSDAYGSTSLAPFFQLDAPTTINGVSIAAGTYIKSAFIADATITNAKIKDAAVDNAKIANLDAAKINTGFLSADRIQAGTIDAKIANLDAAVITSGYIGAARINSASIANANITAAQITTGVIDSARIGNLDASKITSGRLTSTYIDGSNLTITGGSYTGYSWPGVGLSGFYLGYNGLLMGNYYDNHYIQITSTGQIYAPNFSIVNGTLYIQEVTLTRTTRVAGGDYSIPSGLYSNDNGDGTWSIGSYSSQGFTANAGEFFIDTGYDDQRTITDTSRPVYTAKVLASTGYVWYGGSGPGSAKTSDWAIEASVISDLDFYMTGASGAVPGGRLFIRVRVHGARNVHSSIYQLRLDSVKWSMNKVT